MANAPFAFVPSTDPRPIAAPGLWFAFRGRTLLVSDAFTLPKGASLAGLGLSPVRVQLLGHLQGEPCFAAELPADAAAPEGMQFRDLRQLFGRVPEPLMMLAGRAVQLVDWDRSHQFCGTCGGRTDYHPRQRARVCTAADCGALFYPRLSPAMIVAVERGEEILLARSPHFPPGIYSVLAGFVEPGESVEDAVHREVFEETGVLVRNVRYFGSQPWPFPNSLMLGFQADYADGEVTPDPEEIEDAAFFHVDALPNTFPGRVSISQWLLHDFLRRHGRHPGG
jgi:NAD+ diphosphatase